MGLCCWSIWNWIPVILILIFIIWRYVKVKSRSKQYTNLPVRTMIILGSGGHTKEILSLSETLSPSIYSPRIYVHSKSDDLSLKKVVELEGKRSSSDYTVRTIFRSREVGQSWVTSFFTTLLSTAHAIQILITTRPQLVLCNGPGVCVPLCLIAFIATKLGLMNSKLIYVESICRVRSLSLSGWMLRHFVDKFFVQWKNQVEMYPGSLFIGRLS